VEKVYLVEARGELTEADAAAFKARVTVEGGYLCREAKLEILTAGPVSTALVTLTEGRYHQVKLMFQAVGKSVLSLKRVSFAGIRLPDDLPEGQARPLNEEELGIIAPYLSED